MSERDGFQPGVPCWVIAMQPDPAAAVDFYTRLFGWDAEDAFGDGGYFVCRLRGRDVAAIARGDAAAWATHVWVESADDTAARVAAAGGSVLAEPFDLPGVARTAVLADPAGAEFWASEPRGHRGAQLVNEPGAWSMSALNAGDVDGAKSFYGQVFGWQTDSFDLGGIEVTLWRLPGFVGGEPQQPVPRDLVATMLPVSEGAAHWSVDFWVGDVDATADKAAELGGEVIAPPYDIEVAGLRQAVVADPQGAPFSVSKVAAAQQ
jgi:predicted enzyme related to lactoylglutathione lyase